MMRIKLRIMIIIIMKIMITTMIIILSVKSI